MRTRHYGEVSTVEREEAAMGVFITLEEPSRDMKTEAVSAGFYPPQRGTFREAQRARAQEPDHLRLDL